MNELEHVRVLHNPNKLIKEFKSMIRVKHAKANLVITPNFQKLIQQLRKALANVLAISASVLACKPNLLNTVPHSLCELLLNSTNIIAEQSSPCKPCLAIAALAKAAR